VSNALACGSSSQMTSAALRRPHRAQKADVSIAPKVATTMLASPTISLTVAEISSSDAREYLMSDHPKRSLANWSASLALGVPDSACEAETMRTTPRCTQGSRRPSAVVIVGCSDSLRTISRVEAFVGAQMRIGQLMGAGWGMTVGSLRSRPSR